MLGRQFKIMTNIYSFEKLRINKNNKLFRMFLHKQVTTESHSHSFLELAYLLDGTCTHILNGKSTTLTPGDYVIIDYNSVHCYICDDNKPITLIDCIFVPGFINRPIKNCNSFKNLVSNYQFGIDCENITFSPTDYTFRDNNGFIKQLLEMMIYEYDNQKTGYLNISGQYLSQIFFLTLRELSGTKENQTSDIIRYVIDSCKKRYSEKKLLDSLCRELHYAKPYLSTKFKNELNINFKDYLSDIRIDNACRLLTGTNKKVNEIASLVGYNDVAFFIKTFKSKTNLTPVQFRKAACEPILFSEEAQTPNNLNERD